MQPVKPRIVSCPTCRAEVPWVEESKYRPFCSPRCKGIDLGAWASEQYRVASTGDTPDIANTASQDPAAPSHHD